MILPGIHEIRVLKQGDTGLIGNQVYLDVMLGFVRSIFGTNGNGDQGRECGGNEQISEMRFS